MTIASSSGLSDSQIEAMVAEAEKHAEADKAKRELIEVSVSSSSTCTDTLKSLEEFKDQLEKTEAETVQKLITELQELAAKGQEGEGDAEVIKAKKVRRGRLGLADVRGWSLTLPLRPSPSSN